MFYKYFFDFFLFLPLIVARDFNLLNNIDFGSTGFNLTSVVSNVQNNRVTILQTHFPNINQQNGTFIYEYGGLPFPEFMNKTDRKCST